MSPPTTTRVRALTASVAVWAGLAASACASAGGGGTAPASSPGQRPADAAPAEAATRSYTDADVAFMRGMIHHHAQAVAMARLAPDRVESPALRRLTARILNSQKTEIALMADWLRARNEPVPEIAAAAVDAAERGGPRDPTEDHPRENGREEAAAEIAPSGGWDAGPQMPGVLSDAKMHRLETARGAEFDRLFLTYMIEHHEGAVTMVKSLVRSPGGAREESVFRLASGIRADQSSEIDRMRSMLRDALFGDGSR